LIEQAKIEDEAKKAVRELTKFLGLFTEQSASARLLLKDHQVSHLERIAKSAKAEAAIMK
jgi:DNA-dependent RNA polymerase auxiliary subunit epsilon